MRQFLREYFRGGLEVANAAFASDGGGVAAIAAGAVDTEL